MHLCHDGEEWDQQRVGVVGGPADPVRGPCPGKKYVQLLRNNEAYLFYPPLPQQPGLLDNGGCCNHFLE